MTTEELREEYEVFLLFYRDIPFNRIPRRFCAMASMEFAWSISRNSSG